MSFHYDVAMVAMQYNNRTINESTTGSDWRTSLSTMPHRHAVEFLKGFFGNRIRFISAAISTGVNAVVNLALTIIKIFKAVICNSISLLSLAIEFNGKLFFNGALCLMKPSDWEATPHAKETYVNFAKMLNSIIGIAIPVLAYGIDQKVRNYSTEATVDLTPSEWQPN